MYEEKVNVLLLQILQHIPSCLLHIGSSMVLIVQLQESLRSMLPHMAHGLTAYCAMQGTVSRHLFMPLLL